MAKAIATANAASISLITTAAIYGKGKKHPVHLEMDFAAGLYVAVQPDVT